MPQILRLPWSRGILNELSSFCAGEFLCLEVVFDCGPIYPIMQKAMTGEI